MIECPNCRHQEFVGTLFCSECGTRLTHVAPLSTLKLDTQAIDYESVTTKPSPPEGPDLASGAFLGLRVCLTGDIISLLGRENYTLGRSGQGQAIIPDIDLISYDAYEQGVSRIHAEIQLAADGIIIRDLDSANFTKVNGKQLDPQQPYPIRHGDIIELGGLRLQLMSRLKS
jgi:hypothetical protein